MSEQIIYCEEKPTRLLCGIIFSRVPEKEFTFLDIFPILFPMGIYTVKGWLSGNIEHPIGPPIETLSEPILGGLLSWFGEHIGGFFFFFQF